MPTSVRSFPKVLPHQHQPVVKPKRSRGRLVLWALLLITAGGLALWVFKSPAFAINTVEITGTDAPAARVFGETLKGQNIFLANPVTIESNLKKAYPPIASVTVVRGIPHTLRLQTTLRQPKLKWQVGDTVWILDDAGMVFDKGDKPDYASLPLVKDTSGVPVSLGQPVVGGLFMQFIDTVVKQSPTKLQTPVAVFEVGDTTLLVDGFFKGGNRIRFAIGRDVNEQLDDVALILKAHPNAQLVDVRVPGWGYWK